MATDVEQTNVQALADALPILAFVTDADGLNTFTNRPFQSFCGRDGPALLGKDWVEVLHMEDRARARRTWQHSLSRGVLYEAEYRVQRYDGVYRWHLCRGNVVRDSHGTVVAWVGTCTDIEERQRADANLQELLTTLPVGVLIGQDRACDFITGNPAAAELLKMPLGSNLSLTAPAPERAGHFRILQNGSEVDPDESPIRRAARGQTVRDEPLTIAFNDGDTRHILVSARPLYDSVGEVRGAVASLMDVSALNRANDALHAADRRKDEFLAILAHELRNPMASLQTGLELLQHADLSAGLADTRSMMQRQLGQLSHVVDALLEVSRLNRGEIDLRISQMDLNDVLDAALEVNRPVLAAHELIVERTADSLTIDGDRIRLTQVISNLLSNAARFGGESGTIRLSSEVADGDVVVRVRDWGRGVAPERHQEIFSAFNRSAEPSAEQAYGLGVGLALARHLLALHHGSIEVVSSGVGQGSEFVVRLPRHQSTAAARPTTESMTLDTTQPILVVDDHADSANALGTLLRLDGHTVQVVHDGPSALEALAEFEARVVLLDIGMPQMDGYDLARRIRRLPGGQQIKLVAITGWGQDRDRARAREAGIDEHITKPVELAQLRRLLTTAG